PMHFLMDLLLEDPRPPLKTGAHEPEASNSWSSLSPTGTLPTARYYHTAVWGISSSGKHGFYIFGGDASNSWSSLSPTGTLPTARYYHTAVWGISSSGEYGFYIFGGHDGGLLNDLHFYCQASNSWSLLSPTGTLPTARYYHTAVWGISSSGKHGFYIFGGWTGSR
ncbi:unnamed protein product, partial [Durusdinium trenchii]